MITPMVAKLVREPFDREGWFFELKWDGFRAIAETDGAGMVKLCAAATTRVSPAALAAGCSTAGAAESGRRSAYLFWASFRLLRYNSRLLT